MATSSILGGSPAARQPAGTDVDSLGPSDTSDTGSDASGTLDPNELQGDSDAAGTGERATVEPHTRADADILPDQVEALGDDLDDDLALDDDLDAIVDSLALDDVDDEDLDTGEDIAG